MKRLAFAAWVLATFACGTSSDPGGSAGPPRQSAAPVGPPASVSPEWEAKRTEFVESCVDGAGPTVDRAVSTEACTCVFAEVSRRWTPGEFVAGQDAIARELMARGVLRDCRTAAQARRAPAR